MWNHKSDGAIKPGICMISKDPNFGEVVGVVSAVVVLGTDAVGISCVSPFGTPSGN